MTKRILQTIKLDKIAAVDNPCQEGAIVSIMKRAPVSAIAEADQLDDALIKRMADLRNTIVGATYVVNTLLKQGYYARMKHPDGSLKHFECNTSNRQVARARALATHPGHSIIQMHEKNLKTPNPMLIDRNEGARRGKQAPRSARQLQVRPMTVNKTKRLFPDLKSVRTKSGLKGGRNPADVHAQSDRLRGESGTNRKPMLMEKFQPRLNRQQRILVKLNHVVDRAVAAKQDSVEIMRKVIGNTAADYIHDFVNSDNPKFKGKSKQERIKQALGAYYGNK